jgi:SPP1 gp7 family putative phage head morphogenesis protein
VGVYRGTLMARTEIVRAHAESTLNRFEEFGLRNVVNMAEWQTAGDHRVCPLCAQLQGRTFTIQEARGMLPLHPNCRCTWLPVLAEILTGNIRGRNFLGRNYRVFSPKIPGGVYRR